MPALCARTTRRGIFDHRSQQCLGLTRIGWSLQPVTAPNSTSTIFRRTNQCNPSATQPHCRHSALSLLTISLRTSGFDSDAARLASFITFNDPARGSSTHQHLIGCIRQWYTNGTLRTRSHYYGTFPHSRAGLSIEHFPCGTRARPQGGSQLVCKYHPSRS